jgi:hypothetical protein
MEGTEMSVKSQENNMERLTELLGNDLSYVWGEREGGPNGDKKTFLNVGKTFLRALGKDLGLRDVKVMSNAGGIAVSGDCYLYGMWEDGGIYISVGQMFGGSVILYRTIRNLSDHKGGHNDYIRLPELQNMSYSELLERFNSLRRYASYGLAA